MQALIKKGWLETEGGFSHRYKEKYEEKARASKTNYLRWIVDTGAFILASSLS